MYVESILQGEHILKIFGHKGANSLYLWDMEATLTAIEGRLDSIESRLDAINSFMDNYLGPLAHKVESLSEHSEEYAKDITSLSQGLQIAKEMLSENDRDFADIYKKLALMAQAKNDLDAGRAVLVHEAEVVEEKKLD